MPDSPTSPRSSFWKIFIRAAFVVVLILLATFCFAPILLSTEWGTKTLVKIINDQREEKIQIQDISLSWLGEQQISGITFSDPQRQIFATCTYIHSDASLVSMLFGKHHLGDFKIVEPNIKIKKELVSYTKPNAPEFQKASLVFIPSFDTIIKNSFFPISGNFQLIDGRVELVSLGVDPIVFEGIQSTLFLARDQSHITLTLMANSSQQNIPGHIFFEGFLKDINTDTPSFTTKTNITNFPIKGIDQITSLFYPHYKGLLLEAIGPSLSVSLQASLSKTNLEMSLEASSQNFKGHLQTQASEGLISLKNPASFSLSITPSFANKLLVSGFQMPSLSLMSPLTITWSMNQFSLPIADSQLDIDKLSFQSKLFCTPLALGINKTDPITISPLEVSLSSSSLHQGIDFALLSTLSSAGSSSQLELKGKITDVLTSFPNAQFSMKASQFPTKLIDGIASNPYASASLGNVINLDANANIASDKNEFIFDINTPTLTILKSHWLFTNQWELQEPFTVTFAPSAAFYATIFSQQEVIPAPSHPLQFNIESCQFSSLSALDQMQMKASLQTSLLSYKKAFVFSPYAIENLSVLIDVNTYNQIKIDLQSSILTASFEGSYNEKKHLFTFKKPILLTYLITDDQLSGLAQDQNRPYLIKPSLLEMHLDPMTVPLASSWQDLSVKGNVLINELLLQSKDTTQQALFKKSKFDFDLNGKKSTLDVKLTSDFSDGKSTPGKLDAQIHASSFLKAGVWDSASLVASSHISIQNLSSSFLQTLLSQQNSLEALLGPSMNIKLDLETSSQNQTISLEAKSPLLLMKGSALFADETLTLQGSPLEIQLTITPQGYPLLDSFLTKQQESSHPFSLLEPTTFNCQITDLYLPLVKKPCLQSPNKEPCLQADIANLKLTGKLENKTLSFLEKESKQSIALKNFTTEFNKASAAAPLVVKMDTQAFSSSGSSLMKNTSQEGTVSMQAKFDHLFSPEGNFDLSHLSSDIDVTIQKLPSLSLDVLSRAMGKTNAPFSTIFGPSINATLQVTLQDATGPIKLNINSANTRASLVGKLTQGVLTLNESIYGQITMTPEMSSLFLKEINPLGITSISSKNPITIEIDAPGFSLPIAPFHLEKVNIPNAKLELGRIYCKNEGNLNIALGLLKSTQISENQDLQLWFAPIDFHINNGVVNIERSEILVADTFDIALWGQVDPVQDQVRMILGLTAQCLSKAFGIKNLQEDYVLQIPMTGKMNNVKIDKGKATAKIAALLVWQQKSIAGDAIGGAPGALFNQFLNKLGSLPLNDEPTPPAKHPFPWETEGNPKKRPASNQGNKKSHIKPKDKPLKQIYKIVK